jgi:AbrB family looped-hinge helix DNA binding protein
MSKPSARSPFYERLQTGLVEGIRFAQGAMLSSTVTKNGQTTIPRQIREALGIKPGDRLVYAVEGDCVTIRVHPGTMAFQGVLAGEKGKELSFAQIRKVAAASR